MSTSVKLFTSDQAGAPQAGSAAGTLVGILDACLVNGFGLSTCTISVSNGVATVNTGANAHSAIRDGVMLVSGATPSALNGEKRVLQVTSAVTYTFAAPGVPDGAATGSISQRVAPAGWERPFSGTNVAVYRSPDTAGPRAFYEVDDTVAGPWARVRGYESMTAVGTGEGRFPTTAQSAGSHWLRGTAAGYKWVLLCNGRTVYFCQGLGSTASWPRGQLYHFGEISALDGGREMWTSSVSGAQTESPGRTLGSSIEGFFWIARSPLTGLPGAQRAVPRSLLGSSTSGSSGGHLYPNPVGASLLLERVTVTTHGSTPVARLGWLPGLLHIGQAIPEADLAAPLFVDGAGSLQGRRVMVISIQEGNFYAAVGFDITGPWA